MNVYEIYDNENQKDSFNGKNKKDVTKKYLDYFPNRVIKKVILFGKVAGY